MSTNDVPGADPNNHDELAMGCWSEHEDGSLIFVESTEGGRVIYSIFDLSKDPPVEYRDAMPEESFKSTFSWDPDDPDDEKWAWHDKIPMPWDRIIKEGVSDGTRLPSAQHIFSAAERVAESLRLKGVEISREIRHRGDRSMRRVSTIWDKINRAIGELRR